MSVAKEGKVLEQKKLLQSLLATPEGIYSGCIIIFSTSAPSVVYPIEHSMWTPEGKDIDPKIPNPKNKSINWAPTVHMDAEHASREN